MRYFLYVFLISAITIGMFSFSETYAEEILRTEQELDEISVTATRLERKTVEVPASIVIIDEERIKDTKMFNLKEAMTGIPGILIDTKNQGYDSRLIIRGAGLKARYGVRDIMVLLDGVPITDPDSFTRLDFIDTQLIERVEVVKGPNSTMWGANAAGGVINIITKSPMERKGGVIKLGAGHFETRNYHMSYSNSLSDKFFFSFNGSRRESDNSWRRWNEFWTNQFSFQPSFILNDGTAVENHYSYTKASLQLPGSLNEEQFEEYKDTGTAEETFGAWQYSGRYSESHFFSTKLSKEIGSFDIKPLVYVNKWEHHHPVTGRINDADTLTYGADIQINNNHSIRNKNGTLTFGFTARYDNQETEYFEYRDLLTGNRGRITEVLSDNSGDNIESQTRKTFLWGLYVQESIRPSDRLVVDMGARFDKVEFDISGTKTGDYDWASGTYLDCPNARLSDCGDYSIDKNFDAVSPRVGATYKVSEILHLYGNISTGIQTPTEGEFSENPELDLVKITNYEVGLKARHSKITVDAGIYYSPVKDEIVSVTQEDGTTDYVNAGQTKKTGTEFSGTYHFTETLDIGGTYAYSDYEFDEFSEPVGMRTKVNVDRSGNNLPYVPRHQYSIFTNYRHPSGLRSRVQSHSWGSYYMDNANTEKYKGYAFVTNAMVGFEKGSFDISLNVDNVFNDRYAVEVKKDTLGIKTYSPASPRSFIATATYKF